MRLFVSEEKERERELAKFDKKSTISGNAEIEPAAR